jgi:hypothetical protein
MSARLENIKNSIPTLDLNSTNQKLAYGDNFYHHLDQLFHFRLVKNQNIAVNSFRFDHATYQGSLQYAFENSILLENETPKEIDWDLVDTLKDELEDRLKKILKHEASSDFLKPFINFTISSVEDCIIYDLAHPDSVFNPSNDLWYILQKGHLFYASSDIDVLKDYKKNIFRGSQYQGNLGVLTKTAKEKFISGLITDNRYNTQQLVLDYLKNQASGVNNAKNITTIITYLADYNINTPIQKLKSDVLLPLKREGFIGSNTNGYFFIVSIDDILQSRQHHLDKLEGIQRTLKVYDKKLEIAGYKF